MRCAVIRGDAWLVLLSPCKPNSPRITLKHVYLPADKPHTKRHSFPVNTKDTIHKHSTPEVPHTSEATLGPAQQPDCKRTSEHVQSIKSHIPRANCEARMRSACIMQPCVFSSELFMEQWGSGVYCYASTAVRSCRSNMVWQLFRMEVASY